ncbi:O-antigen ligase family protein [Psychrobacillus psychrotolerans]|uniref:O-antigen ligase family protein n=1 Tax=Psychrobacillus psychrotolerans TaxID=126156 RepID=UPI0033160EC3
MSKYNAGRITVTRDEKEDKVSIERIDRLIFWLFLAALTLIPLVIGAKANLFVSPSISGTGITSTGYQLDFFTYFKFVSLLIITLLSLGIFLYKVLFLNYKIKWDVLSFSIIAFIVSLTLSVIFAEYKSIALWGLYNRYDGAITFISYAVLMFIAIHITYPKNALSKLVYTLYPFVWINVIIALMNLYGVNILQNANFHDIFTLFLIDEMAINEGSVLTGTLNQWNYMSGYSAVMAIIFLTLAIFKGSIKSRVVNLMTAVASFLTILASTSTSGFITLVIMTVLLMILAIVKKNKKKAIVWLGIFIILASSSTGLLSKQNPKVWDESVGFFIKTNPFVKLDGAFLELNFPNYKVEAAESTLELPTLAERYYSAGSGRTYIWVKVLELVKEKPITGYGLDTLTYHFPQNDINKRSGMFDENIIIDKPHNFFINILYGSGLLGFLSLICFVSIYSFKLFKYVIKDKQSPIIWAFILGWGAFLIQGIFNDSVIGATIVPFLSISIIYAISKRNIKE